MPEGQSVHFSRLNTRYFHVACNPDGRDEKCLQNVSSKAFSGATIWNTWPTVENNIKMYLEEELGEIVLGLFGTEWSTITSPVSVTTQPAYWHSHVQYWQLHTALLPLRT